MLNLKYAMELTFLKWFRGRHQVFFICGTQNGLNHFEMKIMEYGMHNYTTRFVFVKDSGSLSRDDEAVKSIQKDYRNWALGHGMCRQSIL